MILLDEIDLLPGCQCQVCNIETLSYLMAFYDIDSKQGLCISCCKRKTRLKRQKNGNEHKSSY